jgi:hypothetical protein
MVAFIKKTFFLRKNFMEILLRNPLGRTNLIGKVIHLTR